MDQKKVKIEGIRNQIIADAYRFTLHAFERCVERSISPQEIRELILSGEIIEAYPKDKYGPSCLIYGSTLRGRILPVHCSTNPVWIITADDPTLAPEEWEDGFKRRRRK